MGHTSDFGNLGETAAKLDLYCSHFHYKLVDSVEFGCYTQYITENHYGTSLSSNLPILHTCTANRYAIPHQLFLATQNILSF